LDDVSSKGKYVASSDSGSTKRSHKRSLDDREDRYNLISEKLEDVALALQIRERTQSTFTRK
jgi:hypothetical protein